MKQFIEPDAAIAMLPDGEWVHTFCQAGPVLLGCDYKRADAIAVIRNGKPELSGETATRMGHGLCVIRDDGPLFIATKEKDTEAAAKQSEGV